MHDVLWNHIFMHGLLNNNMIDWLIDWLISHKFINLFLIWGVWWFFLFSEILPIEQHNNTKRNINVVLLPILINELVFIWFLYRLIYYRDLITFTKNLPWYGIVYISMAMFIYFSFTFVLGIVNMILVWLITGLSETILVALVL